jgi:hypothetical protein
MTEEHFKKKKEKSPVDSILLGEADGMLTNSFKRHKIRKEKEKCFKRKSELEAIL